MASRRVSTSPAPEDSAAIVIRPRYENVDLCHPVPKGDRHSVRRLASTECPKRDSSRGPVDSVIVLALAASTVRQDGNRRLDILIGPRMLRSVMCHV